MLLPKAVVLAVTIKYFVAPAGTITPPLAAAEFRFKLAVPATPLPVLVNETAPTGTLKPWPAS